MASGDRSPGPRREAVLVRLPHELVILIDVYLISKRYSSRQAAIQSLLETHPALTECAKAIYDKYNTSPRSP